MERSSITVSPFDGVNRIRFKGSPDCGFRNADCGLNILVFNPHSAISTPQLNGLSAGHWNATPAPPKALNFQLITGMNSIAMDAQSQMQGELSSSSSANSRV